MNLTRRLRRSAVEQSINTEEGSEDAPQTATGFNNLALLCVRQGRYAEAVQQYQAALKTNADDEDLHYNLGIAYVRLGRTNFKFKSMS